jgi:hypothetical protein
MMAAVDYLDKAVAALGPPVCTEERKQQQNCSCDARCDLALEFHRGRFTGCAARVHVLTQGDLSPGLAASSGGHGGQQ